MLENLKLSTLSEMNLPSVSIRFDTQNLKGIFSQDDTFTHLNKHDLLVRQ